MTVYIDDMYRYRMGQFRRMKMSHMIADTEDELHQMASKIGMHRRWYQGDHYDVSLGNRRKAIELGAVEVSLKTLSMMNFVRRCTGVLPGPDTTLAEFESILRSRKTKDVRDE